MVPLPRSALLSYPEHLVDLSGGRRGRPNLSLLSWGEQRRLLLFEVLDFEVLLLDDLLENVDLVIPLGKLPLEGLNELAFTL